MPYDEDLAHRIRALLATEHGVQEKKMFGGLAFLLNGHMAIAASGQGGLLVRVDPEHGDQLAQDTDAEPAVMRGRPMTGWLRIAPEHVRTEPKLRTWVQLGTKCARSLPKRA